MHTRYHAPQIVPCKEVAQIANNHNPCARAECSTEEEHEQFGKATKYLSGLEWQLSIQTQTNQLSNKLATKNSMLSSPSIVTLTMVNCKAVITNAMKSVRVSLSALFMPLDACTRASASSFIAFRQSTKESRYGLRQNQVTRPEATNTMWELANYQ